jgi:hypothetical protein
MTVDKDKIMTVRNTYCKQIGSLEEIYECSGHDLWRKEPVIFYQVESYKAFVSALDWMLKE